MGENRSGAAASDLAAAKRELRTAARDRRRRDVPGRDRDADAAAIADAVLAHVRATGGHGPVAAYASMPLEPPTDVLVTTLQHHGYRVLLPLTLPDRDLDWFDAADHDRIPLGQSAIGDATLVVVPASGVDADGNRLGRGGGSYDRALTRTTAPVLALVWPWELTPDAPLPAEPHDRPVHAAVAPGTGLVRLG